MITPSETIELKRRIKAEMARRNGYGSLAEFADASYDFNVQPAYGEKTLVEHGAKTIDLLLQICDHGDLALVKENNPIPTSFDSSLLDYVNLLAAEPRTGDPAEHSSCRSHCSGLCAGSCVGQCNGCQGCTASCGSGCAGSTMVSSR